MRDLRASVKLMKKVNPTVYKEAITKESALYEENLGKFKEAA